MALNSSQKQSLLAISLTLLITSCASSSNISSEHSKSDNAYWYCAPGDKKSWRCAEEKESLGLSYYRFWKTTLDLETETLETENLETETLETETLEIENPEAEQLESDESEQSGDEPVVVQGAKVSVVEELSVEVADETVAALSNHKGEEGLNDELLEESSVEPLSQQPPEQPAVETKPTYAQSGKYGKVLQLAAYHSQSQARSFAGSLDIALSKKPSLIRTRVNGQIYYTLVFDQLSSQQDAEQLIAELAESFPTIQPWLRSRSGFEALRAD